MNKKKEDAASNGKVSEDLECQNPDQDFLKAKLAHYVHLAIDEAGLTQQQAAKRIGITQPDISKLKHGHYSRFTAERLINFLNILNYNIDIHISKSSDNNPRLTIVRA